MINLFINFLTYLSICLVIFLFLCSNTIYALLSIIGIVCCLSSLLLFLNLEFFAIIYILIYIGVIAVFFVFTIMLLNLRFEKVDLIANAELFYSTIFFIIMNLILDFCVQHDLYNLKIKFLGFQYQSTKEYLVFSRDFFVQEDYQINIDIMTHGVFLYVKYGFYVFIIGLLLLLSLIASIHIIYVTKLQCEENITIKANKPW